LTVNSNPVPFFMKVGEAGEAFFVVETEEDVPDELLTSPLLGATEVSLNEELGEEEREGRRCGTREDLVGLSELGGDERGWVWMRWRFSFVVFTDLQCSSFRFWLSFVGRQRDRTTRLLVDEG